MQVKSSVLPSQQKEAEVPQKIQLYHNGRADSRSKCRKILVAPPKNEEDISNQVEERSSSALSNQSM